MQLAIEMDPVAIIKKYYDSESRSYYFLINHSIMVTEKALRIASRVKHLSPDLTFIREASMLHDMGIFLTDESKIGCHGDKPYICHGYLGRELIEKEGFPRHALICERHIGVGISLRESEGKNLPLPKRDMLPVTIEEQIICFADKFFSKDTDFLLKEKPLEKIRSDIAAFGADKLRRFDDWLKIFGD